MKCSKCGNEIEDGMKFCNKCGNKIEYFNCDYYKDKVEFDKNNIGNIEKLKLISENPEEENYIGKIIQKILVQNGYDSKYWKFVDNLYNQEFQNTEFYIEEIEKLYKKIENENDILNKYDGKNEAFLTKEELNEINAIKKEIELKSKIEIHNVLLEKVNRIESNIDKIIPKAQENFSNVQKQNDVQNVSVTFSVIYTIIAIIFIAVKIDIMSFFSGENVNIVGIVIGLIVIAILIVVIISMYLGCFVLMNRWYKKIGFLSYIFGIFGVVYGPVMALHFIRMSYMKSELGYSDPSMSDMQVINEYEKLQAIRNYNKKNR